ncbi:hypothetical protein AD998_02490 [bacterium 336/3]|nr:hypothetical protein AD998_02490 [bacterium 336/3]
MKIYILLIWLFFSFSQSSFCQNKPDFKNQGEQELYWAKKFFEKNYKKQNHKIFEGKIKRVGNTFEFSSRSFTLDNSNGLEILLEKGVFYPQIIFGEWVQPSDSTQISFQDIMEPKNATISNFKELKNFTNNYKVKRFWFWLFKPLHMNPDVYLMELTNESATEFTPLENFMKGAKLTFIKYAWTNI